MLALGTARIKFGRGLVGVGVVAPKQILASFGEESVVVVGYTRRRRRPASSSR